MLHFLDVTLTGGKDYQDYHFY